MEDDRELFDDLSDETAFKRLLIERFFPSWSEVHGRRAMMGTGRLLLADLFAGPGWANEDGESWAVEWMERVAGDPDLREMTQLYFSDINPKNVQDLKDRFDSHHAVPSLRHAPAVLGQEWLESAWQEFFREPGTPALVLLDPFRFKNFSGPLLEKLTGAWQCDVILFYDYNRVNLGVDHPVIQSALEGLIGTEESVRLRSKLGFLTSAESEPTLVEAVCQACTNRVGKTVLPFCLKNEAGKRTSHHGILVTSAGVTYKRMKEWLAGEGNRKETSGSSDARSFGYYRVGDQYPILHSHQQTVDDLAGQLVRRFRGRTMKLNQIVQQHHWGTPFVREHYREVLSRLHDQSKVRVIRDFWKFVGDC